MILFSTIFVLVSVFEGVEKAAIRLKDEVLGRLCVESVGKERVVREAAEVVLERKEEVRNQLILRKNVLETARQDLLKAVNELFDALEAELDAEAVEKQEALIKQSRGLEAAALGLKQAKEGAEHTLGPLVVEERPVEIVETCLRLKQELGAVYRASQISMSQAPNQDPYNDSAPLREANLHVTVETLDAVSRKVKELGWVGLLDVDVAKCSVMLDEAEAELYVKPGSHFSMDLVTRDSKGRPLTTGGLPVAARAEPKRAVDGDVTVRDKGNGTYTIGFKANDVPTDDAEIEVTVEISGRVVQGCPICIVPLLSKVDAGGY